MSDLLREKEELKAALEEERNRRDEIQREAMKENTKLAQAAFNRERGTSEKILKEIEKLVSKEDAVRQAPVLGQEGETPILVLLLFFSTTLFKERIGCWQL